jgi:hypothetical protein
MVHRLRPLIGLLACLSAWPAAADPPKDPPPPVGPSRAAPLLPAQLGGNLGSTKVGAWVEYVVADRSRRATLRMRLAIVERSEAGTWFEMTFTMPGMERLIIKTLTKGDARHPAALKRLILRIGNQQPLEIVGGPPSEAAPRWQAAEGGTAKRIGGETVRVPAGALAADHYRSEGKPGVIDTWLSPKLPLFSLVKLKSRDYIYELAASGFDAKSQVTGRVGKLDLATLRAAAGGAP